MEKKKPFDANGIQIDGVLPTVKKKNKLMVFIREQRRRLWEERRFK